MNCPRGTKATTGYKGSTEFSSRTDLVDQISSVHKAVLKHRAMQKCSSCKQGPEQGAQFSWKVEPSGASEGRLFSTCDRCRGRKSAAKKGLSGTEPDLESLSSEVTELRGKLQNLEERRASEVTELRGRVQNLEERLTMMEQGGADLALSDMLWDETGADMAEWFALRDPSEPVEAGDIVELIDGQISRKPNLE